MKPFSMPNQIIRLPWKIAKTSTTGWIEEREVKEWIVFYACRNAQVFKIVQLKLLMKISTWTQVIWTSPLARFWSKI